MGVKAALTRAALTRAALTRAALTLGLVAALSGGMAPTAHAASTITFFTDQSLFQAAFPNLATGSFLNDFTGANGLISNYNASGNGFSYAATESGATPQNTYRSNNLLQTDAFGRDLIFTATGGNYNAIGGNFFRADEFGVFSAGSITVTVSNGTETASQTYTPTSATAGSFRGFLSTLPIATLTITGATATGDRIANSADNLRVGTTVASVNTAAPEPGSLALLLPVLGMVGMGIRKRRKA